MKIYQVVLTLAVVVVGLENSLWSQQASEAKAPCFLGDDTENLSQGLAVDCNCETTDGLSFGDGFISESFAVRLASVVDKLSQPNCETCEADNLDEGYAVECASTCDGSSGSDAGDCDSEDCSCEGRTNLGLQNIKTGIQSLLQGCFSDVLVCDSTWDWYCHSRPPKRKGGGPFRKHGPCWYTAPTEWTLFGIIPLSPYPTCLSHQRENNGHCDTDCGCAVYLGNATVDSLVENLPGTPPTELLPGQIATQVSIVVENEQDTTEEKDSNERSLDVSSRRHLKKSISFRRDTGTVARAAHDLLTQAEFGAATEVEEPIRQTAELQSFVEPVEELQLVPANRLVVPQRTSNSSTLPFRSRFGKASLKISE